MRRPPAIILASIAVIVLLGAFAYANSIHGSFIWDDIAFVKDNPLIKSWSNLGRIFTKDIATSLGEGGVKYNFYRPIHMLTCMADYSLWGLRVEGYHFTNILLHILVALCLCWLCNILFGDAVLSLFASVLWLLHPIHTAAVSYISGRADPFAL